MLAERTERKTQCLEFLFHRQGLCFCPVAEYNPIVCISDVEVIAFSLFPPSGSLPFGEIQIFGFHIPVEFMKVYVGQQGAHYSPHEVANFFFRDWPPPDMHPLER
jgi:hypothetical protein